MNACRVDLLPQEEAKKVAEAAGVNPAFAELNIFRLLLQRPKAAKGLADLLLSLLFGAALDNRLRELVIMRIGWATGSDYEWTQHWKIAQQFGCTPAELLAVRSWRDAAGFGETERTLLGAVDELLETGSLAAESFQACHAALGQDASIELVTAVGAWQLVAKLTRSLEIPLEEGVASWPPDGQRPPRGPARPG